MIQEINLSQMLAMIAVSGSVKQVKVRDGDLTWRATGSIDPTKNSHMISIWWKRSKYSGSEHQYICMSLQEMRKPCSWDKEEKNFLEPVLEAYYYHGDNCNSRTQFIYEIIANKIKIIDDIGLVGNGGEYHDRTNLLKIDPNKIYEMKVRHEGQWATNKKE